VCNTSKCRNIAYQANQCCSGLRVLLRLSRVKCSHSRVLIVTPDQSIATRCDDSVDLAINHIAVVYLKVLPPNQPNSKTKRKSKCKTEKRCEHKRSLRETQANAVCLCFAQASLVLTPFFGLAFAFAFCFAVGLIGW